MRYRTVLPCVSIYLFLRFRKLYFAFLWHFLIDALRFHNTAVLHAVAPLITGVRWKDHVTSTLCDALHWLPFQIALWHTTRPWPSNSIFPWCLCIYRSPPLPSAPGFALSTARTWTCSNRTMYSGCALWSTQFFFHCIPYLEHVVIISQR